LSSFQQPPHNGALIDKAGMVQRTWAQWFMKVSQYLGGNVPFPLASYTVATVPAAADYTGHLIYVSNEAGGAQPAFSDGTNWRRFSDRAIIS
jgi:hypothetical protein